MIDLWQNKVNMSLVPPALILSLLLNTIVSSSMSLSQETIINLVSSQLEMCLPCRNIMSQVLLVTQGTGVNDIDP